MTEAASSNPVLQLRLVVEVDNLAEAEAFRGVLQDLWGSRRTTPALAGTPQARIVEEVLSEEY